MEDKQLLYSQAIISFLRKIKKQAREILRDEVGAKVGKSRFTISSYTYPLNIVVFENPRHLGYFDADIYEIGIHKILMLSHNKEQLSAILRHEIAHYLTFIRYGTSVEDHGKEFRKTCRKCGWEKDVYGASTKGTEIDMPSSLSTSALSLTRKIQKLLALGSSSNHHEAELATIKSQELMVKYNISKAEKLLDDDDDEMMVKRVLQHKRYSAKLEAMTTILRTFFVFPVINSGKSCVYLEVFGDPCNVITAEYVAAFLDKELENLWLSKKREKRMPKGLASKNSFFRGVAEGFCNKIKEQASKDTEKNSKALTVLTKDLERRVPMAYPRLRKRNSKHRHCSQGAALGNKVGKELQIRKACTEKSKDKKFLIG